MRSTTNNLPSGQFVPGDAEIPVRTRVETLRQQAGELALWGKRAARALKRVGSLWRQRLESGWVPPDGSPFPWAQVRLSLAALIPGLETAGEWRERAQPRPPNPLPHAVGEGEPSIAVVTLILAGNTPLMSWSPLCACLLAGSMVFVKMSRDETLWPRLFVESLAEADSEVAARVVVDVWPGDDPRTTELVQSVDAVVAFGSDATLAALRAATPIHTPFFAYGHALSVGIIQADATGEEVRRFADDVLMYDQQGCLSPHTIFYEAQWPSLLLGNELSAAFSQSANTLRKLPVTNPFVASAIRQARDMALFDGSNVRPLESDPADLRWTVIFGPAARDPRPMPLPVGHSIVYCLSFHDIAQELGARLGAARGKISCVGVAGEVTPELRSMLEAEGVSRICKPGEMQTPPLDWPNGDFDLLTELYTYYTKARSSASFKPPVQSCMRSTIAQTPETTPR